MRYLEIPQALAAAGEFGFHVRDIGLLDSALARHAASMYGQDAYGTLQLKAAALFSSLAQNYPLFDAKKRLSWTLTLVFLGLNGYRLIISTVKHLTLCSRLCRGNSVSKRLRRSWPST